jgi:hypothetical protein
MRVLSVAFSLFLLVGIAGCATEPAAPEGEAAAAMPAQAPHATLAQLMRGIPFPNSNTIFDTQDQDPEAAAAGGPEAAGATAQYGGLYGGWQGVENAAMALSETANLLLIPGRMCENGLPVPLQNEDFQRFATGLAEAGRTAYAAAQTKNLDNMVDAAGAVADACAFCHEVYRDKPEGQMRCVP